MNYEQTLAFLYNSLPQFQRIGGAAYKANLDNTIELDEHFGHPHTSFKTIHVAGTNGKGSVSSMIYNILREAGYKVGLYTSPHLVDFRERIEINGELIPKEKVVEFVAKNKPIIERLKPSFFEMTVAMAFDYFRNEKVDYAVIEVGMGGRLDSTNIITPVLSVITNISLDHTQFLGRTLPKIAREKAGIIKPGVPVVVGEKNTDLDGIFIEVADLKRAELVFAENVYRCEINQDGKYVVFDNENNTKEFKLSMHGAYQCKNICTTLAAVDVLVQEDEKISNKAIVDGLEKTVVRGRWEVLGQNPLMVCDTAHNIGGMRYVVEQILSQKYKKLYIVLGFVRDKEIGEILKIMPRGAFYFFTQPSVPRGLPYKDLAELAKDDYELNGKEVATVGEAIVLAKKMAKQNDMIFIGGSTFVVADAIECL